MLERRAQPHCTQVPYTRLAVGTSSHNDAGSSASATARSTCAYEIDEYDALHALTLTVSLESADYFAFGQIYGAQTARCASHHGDGGRVIDCDRGDTTVEREPGIGGGKLKNGIWRSGIPEDEAAGFVRSDYAFA